MATTTSTDRLSQPTPPLERADQRLIWAASLFTVAVVLHGFDHARRGAEAVSLDVFWVGTAAISLEIAVVVLACQRHRLAPLAAMSSGFALAAGYVLVHFLPARGWMSDSLTSGTAVSRLSWAAASLEVVAAMTLGIVGLVILRQRGGPASAVRPRQGETSVATALRHPATVGMIVGNAIILVIALTQLLA